MASETDLQTLKIVNTERFGISISGYQGTCPLNLGRRVSGKNIGQSPD